MSPLPQGRKAAGEIWNALRSGWVSDPAILVEQIAYLLALKRLSGEGAEPSDWQGPGLEWERLLGTSDPKLVTTMSRLLIPFVAESMPRSIRPTMHEAQFAIEDPSLLRACMSELDALPAGSEGQFFEGLLEQLREAGDRRQTRTPPAVAAAMVDLVEPSAGDSICDPAVGSGGLLLQAGRSLGHGRGAGDAELWGYDIDPGKARLAAFNLMFNGILDARIEQADVLAPAFAPPKFDVVLCSPPFGGVRGDEEVDAALVDAGRRTELLYLERCRQIQGGSAAILLPEAVLFGRAGQYVRARREWLQRRRVLGLVLLPPGLLGFTSIRSAILVASDKGTTDELWFCPIGEEATGSSPGESPTVEEQLGCVAEALRSKRSGEEPESSGAAFLAGKMDSASIDEIKDNNWSLAPALYRDIEVPEVEEDPLELLDEIREVETEIDRQLAEARRLLAEPE